MDTAQFGKISFTEFLRVNMRLAEDRILSFVSVFSTGYGTKWVPGKSIISVFNTSLQANVFS
jgi:hypothetical protein